MLLAEQGWRPSHPENNMKTLVIFHVFFRVFVGVLTGHPLKYHLHLQDLAKMRVAAFWRDREAIAWIWQKDFPRMLAAKKQFLPSLSPSIPVPRHEVGSWPVLALYIMILYGVWSHSFERRRPGPASPIVVSM